jgi:4'-phosphopantetheinyl transferase
LGEQQRLAGFAVAKRRRDWLLGRWTAKRLLQSHVARRAGTWLPLDTFVIASDPDGAPRVIVDSSPNLQSAICNLQLSISHCNGNAFCAISDRTYLALGADIERVAPRAPEFAADYFTPRELAQVAASPANERDAIVTLIWSAKEAGLKALRLGLTVDTRRISIELGQRYGAAPAWSPLAVHSTLPRAESVGGIHGWWWRVGEYALTLALLRKGHSPVGNAELHQRPPQWCDAYGGDNVVAQCEQIQDLPLCHRR